MLLTVVGARRATVFLVAGLVGCGSSKATRVAELDDVPVGSEVIVERSAKERPDWVTEPPEEKDGVKYFSGGEEGYADYALGFRLAKAEAWQDAGESVLAIWSSLLQSAEGFGKNDLDQYARNFQELAVKEMTLTGVETERRYYEKVVKKTAYGVENRYNTFVLLSIPTNEWRTAQDRALEQLKNSAREAGDTRAEDFIDEAIERLKQIKP